MSVPTQGPWKYGEFPLTTNGNVYIWNEDETVLVAEVTQEDTPEEMTKANAAIVAASWEMLQVLEKTSTLLGYASNPNSFVELKAEIGAVIRKAKDVSQFVEE